MAYAALFTSLSTAFVPRNLSISSSFSSSSSYSSWSHRALPLPPPRRRSTTSAKAPPLFFICAASASKSSSSSSSAAAENGKRTRGIAKPRRVSPEMQALVGAAMISRTQVLKLIWAHIKDNNLQDPENRKVIVCDEKLKSIFGGRERVGFLEIASLISPHFLK